MRNWARFACICVLVIANHAGRAAEPDVVVIDRDAEARQPQAAVDSRGRIHVAYGAGSSVKWAVSTDGGRSFRVSTIAKTPSLALGMRRGPRIAVSENAVVIAAVVGAVGKGKDGDVIAWRSEDDGNTWKQQRINSITASAREGLHALAAGPAGAVYCAWIDLRNGVSELWGARSADGGVTWEADNRIYRSPDGGICPCCHPAAAFGVDGSLAVMWRNQINNARDLYFARSTDGGKSFGEPGKLGKKTWIFNACPMDGGSIAIGRNGEIESTWIRAGAVFDSEPAKPEVKLGDGAQPWNCTGREGTFRVWLARRPGRLLLQTPSATEPVLLAESANDPAIAAPLDGAGPVVAVWESVPNGGIAARVVAPARAARRQSTDSNLSK